MTCGSRSAAADTTPAAWESATTAWSSTCRPIRYVHVDPAARTVRVGGGCTWGDVDHATHAFGLAVPSGIISTTGVGGLTLGGGMGHLTRKYGLTIDNLLSADVVLADGSFVVASADENTDLFWAIRGGGGNFGVVTSFLFQAHPVHIVCAGPMLWELDQAADIMKWYREFIVQAPEEINGFFAFLIVPPGPPFPEELHFKKMCGIVWCYTGTLEQANEILEPLRSFRPPAFEFFAPDAVPHAARNVRRALSRRVCSGTGRRTSSRSSATRPSLCTSSTGRNCPRCTPPCICIPSTARRTRRATSDTPWSYRDANWSEVIVGVDPDPANKDRITGWAKDYWEALHPYGAGGAYVNFMMENEGEDRIRATYRDNYDRLARIKAKYDPITSSA